MKNYFEILSKSILYFKDMFSFLERNDNLMSREAIELLSNPETREDFIEFTSGKNINAGTDNIETKSKERSKTFKLESGKEITVVTYS